MKRAAFFLLFKAQCFFCFDKNVSIDIDKHGYITISSSSGSLRMPFYNLLDEVEKNADSVKAKIGNNIYCLIIKQKIDNSFKKMIKNGLLSCTGYSDCTIKRKENINYTFHFHNKGKYSVLLLLFDK
jgi:hypothetical protein